LEPLGVSPEVGCVAGVGLRVASRELVVACCPGGVPVAGFAVVACGGESAGETGGVLRIIAGTRHRAEAVDGGLVGALGHVDLGEAGQR
jgi:hypothetical protein